MNPALAELRDIHLPAATPWWEFAVGWWLLLVLCVAGIIWAMPKLGKWYHSRKAQKALKHDIEQAFAHINQVYEIHQDIPKLLAELSMLLKRVAVTLFPSEQVEGLAGQAWLSFLDGKWRTPPEQLFSSPELAGLLLEGPYRKAMASDTEAVARLMTLSQRWLDEVVKQHV